ncbi:MAG: chloride channel protein, partial [Pseudomonadota bacterium]
MSGTFWGVPDELVTMHAQGLAAWQIVMVPCLGGLVIGLLCRFILPAPQPQGVADVIEANALRNGRMPAPQGLAAAFVSASSIGVGASVGREGPIVHLGAVMASWVAQRLHLSPSLSRTLLGCGVSAGIAAAFNAPIAGVFFALEVVIGHYGLGAFSPVVLASIIGTIITRVHIGDNPAFVLPPDFVASFWEVPAFVLLGVVCSGVAIMLMAGTALMIRLHERVKTPVWVRPMLGGAFVGLIAIRYPEVLGVGYQITDNALFARYTVELMFVMAAAKLIATVISLG